MTMTDNRTNEPTEEQVERLTTELQNKREALNDQRREYRALLSKRDRTIDGLRAERDAALAAIAAVKAIHVEREHRTLDGTYLGGTVCDGCRRPYPCPTVAALDGSPEPEETKWEYGLLNSQAPDGGKLQDGAHLVSDSREHILTQQRRGIILLT